MLISIIYILVVLLASAILAFCVPIAKSDKLTTNHQLHFQFPEGLRQEYVKKMSNTEFIENNPLLKENIILASF